MIRVTRFFYIHWLLIPLILLAWFTKSLYTLLMAYAVVSVHETFHLLTALLVKEHIGSLIVMPFGMTIRLSAKVIRNPNKEICIALAGPLANLVMIFVSDIFENCYGSGSSLFLFRFLNLCSLFINLLPCMPLDGGRVVKCILVKQLGYLSAVSVMKRLGRWVAGVLIVGGILLLCASRCNVSLLMASGFLVMHMAEEQKRNEYVFMKEMLYSKEKLFRKGSMPAKTLGAIETVPAKEIFHMLSYDCFYFIHITDGEQRYRQTISESQLVDGILHHGWQCTLGELCSRKR